ncbi:MAG: hypothetical protein ACJAS2_002421 [Pseudohongiellaceae bacterium]|jgi:hypothetical protein
MKLIAKVIAVLLIIVIVGVIYVAMNLGSLIKQGIEEYAPPIVGTSVTVNSVNIMPFTGSGGINDFNVGNPQGFGDGNALALGEISISIEPASLTKDIIIIDNILIDSPVINFIQLADNSTNFTKLLENVDQSTAAADKKQTTEPEPATDGEATGVEKKFIIKNFDLNNAQLSATIPLLGEKPISLTLPNIHLEGIGEKSGGQHAAGIAKEIGDRLTKAISDTVAKSDEFKKQLTEKLKNEAKDKAEAELTDKLTEKLGAEDTKLLKGLFNR